MNEPRMEAAATHFGQPNPAPAGVADLPAVHASVYAPVLPMIVPDEVADLAARYGAPVQRTFDVQADEYIYSYRWRKDIDRRAEVVFAVQNPAGQVWVHAKPHYPTHVYRLPSGGVQLHETVEDALMREIEEEMGLPVEVARFLGLVEYRFWHGELVVPFVSYIFHLHADHSQPTACEGEQIADFRAVLPAQLGQVALGLRNLLGDRHGWGQWRALAHDLVSEYLSG